MPNSYHSSCLVGNCRRSPCFPGINPHQKELTDLGQVTKTFPNKRGQRCQSSSFIVVISGAICCAMGAAALWQGESLRRG